MVDGNGQFARELLDVMRQDRQDLVLELRLLRADHYKTAEVMSAITARLEGWDVRTAQLETRLAAVEERKAERQLATSSRATNVALTIFTVLASAFVAYLTVMAQHELMSHQDTEPKPTLQGP